MKIIVKKYLIVWITVFLSSTMLLNIVMLISSDSQTEAYKFTDSAANGNKIELTVYRQGDKFVDSLAKAATAATTLSALYKEGAKNGHRSVKITLL